MREYIKVIEREPKAHVGVFQNTYGTVMWSLVLNRSALNAMEFSNFELLYTTDGFELRRAGLDSKNIRKFKNNSITLSAELPEGHYVLEEIDSDCLRFIKEE